MSAFDRDSTSGHRADGRNGPARGRCRRLAIEWIEQRWMLSAMLGANPAQFNASTADLVGSDTLPSDDSYIAEGMLELETATRAGNEVMAASLRAVATGDAVFGGLAYTCNEMVGDVFLGESSVAAPPLQRIPAVPVSPKGYNPPAGNGADTALAGLATEESVGNGTPSLLTGNSDVALTPGSPPHTPPPAVGGIGQRPLPIARVMADAARPDDGGMIDITPQPGQPEVLLARGDLPALDGDRLLAGTADDRVHHTPATPPGEQAEENRPLMRVEGSRGRGQAFDLAWRALEASSAPAIDASGAKTGVVLPSSAAPPERAAETGSSAASSTFDSPSSALPGAKAADIAPGTPAAAEETAALDDVAAVRTAPPAAHAAALEGVSEWLADSLPRLAIGEARRAREVIPLVVLATVGQYCSQPVLPDRSGPSELFPPRRWRRPSGEERTRGG